MAYITRNPHIADHRLVDLRSARRVFVFGDVHSSLSVLIAKLAEVGFDAAAGDVAICLGDWMDRGPDGLVEVRDFLAANPAILSIRGNHEDILRNACHEGGRHDRDQSADILIRNGGSWICDHLEEQGDDDYPDAEATAFADLLNANPIAMTVLTPGGNRIGLVHAAVPAESWDDMVATLEGPDPLREDMAFHCMWDRKAADMAIGSAEHGTRLDEWIVPGIDHVFYGHTRTGTQPVRHGGPARSRSATATSPGSTPAPTGPASSPWWTRTPGSQAEACAPAITTTRPVHTGRVVPRLVARTSWNGG